MDAAAAGGLDAVEARRAALYQQRLRAMQAFFHTLDNLVATFLALDEFHLGALQKLLGRPGDGKPPSRGEPG